MLWVFLTSDRTNFIYKILYRILQINNIVSRWSGLNLEFHSTTPSQKVPLRMELSEKFCFWKGLEQPFDLFSFNCKEMSSFPFHWKSFVYHAKAKGLCYHFDEFLCRNQIGTLDVLWNFQSINLWNEIRNQQT